MKSFDPDEGRNAEIVFSFENYQNLKTEYPNFPFEMDPVSGWISTTRTLDREENQSFKFRVVAEDKGNPVQRSATTLTIEVLDANDNDPYFDKNEYEGKENK